MTDDTLTKDHIGLCTVAGGDKQHGYNPFDGSALCGTRGDDPGADPLVIHDATHRELDFSEGDNQCARCVASYAKLPD